jgi:hypothetical protein
MYEWDYSRIELWTICQKPNPEGFLIKIRSDKSAQGAVIESCGSTCLPHQDIGYAQRECPLTPLNHIVS